MDPQNIASFNHRTAQLSTGRKYHFVDQLPDDYDPKITPTVLCVHGFPESWYGWRYQVGPWVRAGNRVVVPDMLGYGETDKPKDPSEYSTKRLCADIVALLDIIGVTRAVLIGHDWGAFTVGRFALWYPDRIHALVIMSVPYTPPSRKYISIDQVAKLAPNLGYQADFADPATTLAIEAHLQHFLSIIFRPPNSKDKFWRRGSLFNILDNPFSRTPSVLNDLEFQHFLKNFEEGGMTGPLNYYRTSKYRHEEEEAASLPAHLRSDLPVLFIWGTEDSTVVPSSVNNSKKFITSLQDVALQGMGHWVLVEAKDEVTNRVVSWLKGVPWTSPQGKL